jgi:hypothetical protein
MYAGQRRHKSGLVYEYLGPTAVPGPYTVHEGAQYEGPVTLDQGLPANPRGPGDIAAPVELDPGATVHNHQQDGPDCTDARGEPEAENNKVFELEGAWDLVA